MKHNFFTLILFFIISAAGYAQTTAVSIPHAYAFFSVTSPGALQVDENGNAINNFIINRFIYIETSGRQPLDINTITTKSKIYKFTVEAVLDNTITVGNNFITNQPLKIKAAKTNRLWKVSYSPVSGVDIKVSIRNIVIRGKAGAKAFKLVLPKDTQVTGPMLY